MNTKPKFYKAFILIFAVIFLALIITVFIYGLELNFFDDSDRNISFTDSGSFNIFIGGAVENEGLYEVRYSTTYGELFEKAKIKNLEILNRFNENQAIKSSEEFIICHHEENFRTKNINDADVDDLVKYCGMSVDSANAIKEYINEHGKIEDKNLLLEEHLLTKEEFDSVKYKIYAYKI